MGINQEDSDRLVHSLIQGAFHSVSGLPPHWHHMGYGFTSTKPFWKHVSTGKPGLSSLRRHHSTAFQTRLPQWGPQSGDAFIQISIVRVPLPAITPPEIIGPGLIAYGWKGSACITKQVYAPGK